MTFLIYRHVRLSIMNWAFRTAYSFQSPDLGWEQWCGGGDLDNETVQ